MKSSVMLMWKLATNLIIIEKNKLIAINVHR